MHAHERLVHLYATDFLEQIFGHAFEEVDDVILLHKRHFAVNLCEFRLAVSTQVFVTEAFGYLEVTVRNRKPSTTVSVSAGFEARHRIVPVHA